MKRGIVMAEFGSRGSQIHDTIKNVRTVSQLPIVIYSDRHYPDLGEGVTLNVLPDESIMWKSHRRYFNRNNDYWKVEAARLEFDLTLVLDDDMRIVHEHFMQGFDLAEKFGMCIPLNPRVYFGIDREVGDDVPDDVRKDSVNIPYHMTANNMGVLFFNNRNSHTDRVMLQYTNYMLTHPCRGPVAMGISCWNEDFAPYFLPEEWCLCGGHTEFRYRSNKRIDPIFLHVGHPDVNEWFQKEPLFEKYRG